jgi:peptidoglycan/xylan/chitin deacetylase (PgdA/CDA1 family)
MITNKYLLTLFLFLFSFFSYGAEVSITIDDFNFNDQILSGETRNNEILKTLDKHKIKAAGFVSTKYLTLPGALDGLKKWSNSGHLIGNHTENHFSYAKTDFNGFSNDILLADSKLKDFKNFQKFLRFPYLKEGETKEKRDQLRKFLVSQNYKNGAVTIDASDWYVNKRMLDKLKVYPDFDKTKFRDFYLKHLWERAQYYSNLSKETLGKDIKHTLLLHHNLTTSLFLDDLIEMFKTKGWKVIDATEAFNDPIYKSQPENIPAGESLIWALAKDKGNKNLRYPAEDGEYEKTEMDRLGL